MTTTAVRFVLVLGLVSTGAALASDRDFPVDPGRLAMRSTPKGLKVKLQFRKGSVAMPGAESPLRDGAFLHIFNSNGGTDAVCAPMPVGNWRVSRVDPSTGPVGWTYSDARNVNGPVRHAHFGAVGRNGYGDLRVIMQGPSTYTLDETSQGTIAASFRVKNLLPSPNPDHTRYCTDFAPPYVTVTQDQSGSFRALFASQYGGPCPPAPGPCSPGGAFLDAD